MADLPERFLATMREILGEEYEEFLSEFDDRRHYGLRLNTAKISKEEFEKIAPFHLTPIPWIENGYFYEKEDNPARHPFYAAGLYYLQEPSAMTPASRLMVEPGDRVLDLCAAPGGKATALGAALKGQGLLVANDINTARARALLRNLELFGIRNSFVTNEAPHDLVDKFPEYFDKIMVDAPCSGEGMFRKNPMVVDAWLEKGPDYFSNLQKDIIVNAADMLKAGGYLFYSTCTFSPLENESTITHLLKERPQMQVIPMKEYEGFSEGLTSFDGLEFDPSCKLSRRIWPHHMSGEGHFLALLYKRTEAELEEEKEGWESFAPRRNPMEEKNLTEALPGEESEDASKLSDRIWTKEDVEDTLDRKALKKLRKAERKAAKKAQKYAVSSVEDRFVGRDRRGAGKGSISKGKSGKNRASASGEEWALLRDFFSLIQGPLAELLDEDHIDIRGEKVYFVPQRDYENKGIHFLRNGVYLGDLKKNRFEPSQPFALILSKDTYIHCINLSQDDDRLKAYLHGETLELGDILDASRQEECGVAANKKAANKIDANKKAVIKETVQKEYTKFENGWYLLLADGYPLGFGKLAGTTLKNKYPPGWRQNI